MPYPYPTPTPAPQPYDPVAAAQRAQAQLEQIAAAQAEQRRQEQAAAQAQAGKQIGATYAGIKGMDALTGSGAAVTGAAQTGGAAAAGAEATTAGADAGAGAMAGEAGLSGGAALGLGAGGAYGLYDTFSNKKHGAGGAAEGAASGAALGASVGSVVPGLGTAIGAGAGALLGGTAGYFGNFGDKDKFKTEGNRLKSLRDKGINVPDSMMGPATLKQGRTKEQLLDRDVPPDFVGFDPKGQWTNNKFSQSRNEADLLPEDIWGNAAFFEKFGNDWLGKFSADQRFSIAQKALETGAVREHHGTMDIDFSNKDFQSYIDGLSSGKTKANSVADFESSLQHAAPGDPGAGGGGAGGPDAAGLYWQAVQASEARQRAAIASAEKQANSQAFQAKKDAATSDFARFALNNSQKPAPSVQSGGAVRTGVQDLDSILQGVLG